MLILGSFDFGLWGEEYLVERGFRGWERGGDCCDVFGGEVVWRFDLEVEVFLVWSIEIVLSSVVEFVIVFRLDFRDEKLVLYLVEVEK